MSGSPGGLLGMTLTQIRYALAVERLASFGQAARACGVSQPALSMQLKRLEEHLSATLFDRSRKPVVPTEIGTALLPQLARVIQEADRVTEIIDARRGVVAGEYRVGILPTIAPFLVPLFLRPFLDRWPQAGLSITEMTTAEITAALRKGEIDAGILATPLSTPGLQTTPLYDEIFHVYRCPDIPLPLDKQGRVHRDDLPVEKLLVMQEGHCLRIQALDLCRLGLSGHTAGRLRLNAGSIATLLELVAGGGFFTVVPDLAVRRLPPDERAMRVVEFAGPVPYREVSLAVHRTGLKQALRRALTDTIRAVLPDRSNVRKDGHLPLAPR